MTFPAWTYSEIGASSTNGTIDLSQVDFSNYWVYVVGPIAGAALAVGFAWILRGGGSLGGLRAARGLTGGAAALASSPDDSKGVPT